MIRPQRVLLLPALLACIALRAEGQDTSAAAPAVTRHLLAVDVSRARAYRRSFDIVVTTRDSATVIGRRDVSMSPTEYAGAPAWLIVESRSGVVPSAESLFVAQDMRPIHWSAWQGRARLGTEFVGDSIFGATSRPGGGNRNVVIPAPPDLMVSSAMVETLLPLLPLQTDWSDSVTVLSLDLARDSIIPSEIAVIGEERYVADSSQARPVWIVALRAEQRNVLFWIAKDDGEVLRVQQPLPSHVGQLLEYRARPAPVSAPGGPQS